MDNYKRTVIASSDLFSGYKINIDISMVETLDDICIFFKKKLMKSLLYNNFENLIIKLKNTNFHIHTHSIEEIFLSDKNDIIYICDHCQ